MWLVCKTRSKILLSDPETSLTTPRLSPLRRSRQSHGNYQSPQSSGSSWNILKWLGIRTIIWKPGFISLCMSLYSIFTTLISRTPTKCIIKYVLKLTKQKAYFNSSMVIVVGDSVLLLQFVFVGAWFYQGRGVCTHNYGYYRVFCRNERTFVLIEGKANWKIGFNSQLP